MVALSSSASSSSSSSPTGCPLRYYAAEVNEGPHRWPSPAPTGHNRQRTLGHGGWRVACGVLAGLLLTCGGLRPPSPIVWLAGNDSFPRSVPRVHQTLPRRNTPAQAPTPGTSSTAGRWRTPSRTRPPPAEAAGVPAAGAAAAPESPLDALRRQARLAVQPVAEADPPAVPDADPEVEPQLPWGGVERVLQEVVVCRILEQYSALMALLREEMHVPDFRVVVYFPTEGVASAMYRIFRYIRMPVLANFGDSLEMNDIANNQFRHNTGLVMVSHLAPTRGADHRGVTCAIQLSFSESTARYAARLGRPGRQARRNVLLLNALDEQWLVTLAGFNIQRRPLPDIQAADHRVLKAGLRKFAIETQQYDHLSKGHEQEPTAREIYNTYMDILRLYLRNIQVVAKYKSEIIRNANALIMFLYSTSKPPPLIPKTAQFEGMTKHPELHIGEWQWGWWPAGDTFDLKEFGGW